MIDRLLKLEQILVKSPVMGQIHPLIPLCLTNNVERVTDPEVLSHELDTPVPHAVRPVIVTHLDNRFANRFQVFNLSECPPAEIINRNLPHKIDTARAWLLTNHHLADRIVDDVCQRGYETVIFLLVDGLSYADTLHWPERVTPCFIDGPSITFSRTSAHQIDPRVGFPAIINSPSIARRLVEVGIGRQRGYSYWTRAQNDVTEKLFGGMPLKKVRNFEVAFDEISHTDNLKGLYIQIVREGLDGLAHSRRELSSYEINAATQAIYQDLRKLVTLLTEKQVFGAVYLVADHGILWRNEHPWQLVDHTCDSRPRYTTDSINEPEFSTTFFTDLQTFTLWNYPFLGRRIRANDSGVHGGLSYWESIVPFIRVEVNR